MYRNNCLSICPIDIDFSVYLSGGYTRLDRCAFISVCFHAHIYEYSFDRLSCNFNKPAVYHRNKK